MNYVSPIWMPSLSDSPWGDLQVKQNAALRMVIGCHVMTSVPHLHHETRLMMVKEHNKLLRIQFLLGAFKEERPDHWTTEQPPPRSRQVSPTLLAKFSDRLLDHVGKETLKDPDEPAYRAGLAQLHRDLAAKAASSYTPPIWKITWDEPKINQEEEKLPRKTSCTLAQLRSGYSITLNSYKNRLDPSVPDECPECQTSALSAGWGHTMWPTFFECPSKPTNLVPECL